MNDPRQYLVHMTNRGSQVQADRPGDVGQFQCFTRAPMKDINKFGLIHYSIPKLLDTLDETNREFTIRIGYQLAQGGMDYHDIPVRMPLMDYYNMVTSQKYDISIDQKGKVLAAPTDDVGIASAVNKESPFGRMKNVLAFDEVLQTTINWAIQKEWRRQKVAAGVNPMEYRINALSRLSCVVQMKKGRYVLYFGYRGYAVGVDDAPFADSGISGNHDSAHEEQKYTGAYECKSNSGAPCPVVAEGAYVQATANGEYSFIDVAGVHHIKHEIFTAAPTLANIQQIALESVTLYDVSPRMQMFLGTSHRDLSYRFNIPLGANQSPTRTRGWVRICDYNGNGSDGNGRLGMIELEMDLPPNLDPPSFLMLNLTAQGTRTKVLGHENEKGGWAIPTPPSYYRSKYDNQPNGRFYDKNMCRSMPIILTADTDANKYNAWQTHFAAQYNSSNKRAGSGLGYNFDPIPTSAMIAVGSGFSGSTNPVLPLNNFSLVNVPTYGASKHIIFGGLSDHPECAALKHLRSSQAQRGGVNSAGFGTGNYKQSSVFTVTMIEPNWIWCTVEDSTVQTLDVQLAWGDTSESVAVVSGNPVQFSIIASP